MVGCTSLFMLWKAGNRKIVKKVATSLDFLKARDMQCCSSKDCINHLPDEILENILSRLPLREAARTSVLSKRWRHLWKFFSGTFDFDAASTAVQARLFGFIGSVSDAEEQEQRKLVGSLNQALKRHLGPTIDEIRICFDVKCDGDEIDSWVRFAKDKRVRRFKLDLSSRRCFYNFPSWSDKSQSQSSSGFTCLESLHLVHVDILDKDVEQLLADCPCLQVLRIEFPTCLDSLRISGPALKLKRLELMTDNCFTESVEITEAINLVSFKYHGEKTRLSLKNVPNLSEVSFGGAYCEDLLRFRFSELRSNFSQLEVLSLGLLSLEDGMWDDDPIFPTFYNVKQMQLTVNVCNSSDLPYYLCLVECCPLLRRLSLRLARASDLDEEGSVVSSLALKHVVADRPKHECLKLLEIVGFMGSALDVELVMYLVEYAMSVEKVVIDPHHPVLLDRGLSSFEDMNNIEQLKVARSLARGIESKLPPNLELGIL